MQEVRTTCLDLAIKAGATAENAIRVARDFEAYVKEVPPNANSMALFKKIQERIAFFKNSRIFA